MITPQQIEKIKGIENPVMRRRYLKYFQLPDDLQETIFSEKTADKIGEIAKKNNLSDTQIWRFSYLIGLVLLGETPTSELAKKIKDECEVTDVVAQTLTQDIAREIFYPIKESLAKVHGLKPSAAEPSLPLAPTPIPPVPQTATRPPLSPIFQPIPPTLTTSPTPPIKPLVPSSPPQAPSTSSGPSRKIFVPKIDGNTIDLRE